MIHKSFMITCLRSAAFLQTISFKLAIRLHRDLLKLLVLSHHSVPALADQMLVLHALLYSHLYQHMLTVLLAVLLAAVDRGSRLLCQTHGHMSTGTQ